MKKSTTLTSTRIAVPSYENPKRRAKWSGSYLLLKRYFLLQFAIALTVSLNIGAAFAHRIDLSERDHSVYDQSVNPLQTTGLIAVNSITEKTPSRKDTPAIAVSFLYFKGKIGVRWDDDFLYVESDGIPDHPMMVGITNWQQQVPLPQPYTGNNAWRIPRKPTLADNPISAKTELFRGAIALAVNGVPIFNALNNRGEDAFLIGELDRWGGHAGRGDDYHYHAAPLHLQEIVGGDNPIGVALDGFPIYGLTEPDGSPTGELDAFNGHVDEAGNYHYHASETYPYINGGMRGVVEMQDDQIEPQPRSVPVRPATQPLRGAEITGFTAIDINAYSVEYQHNGQSNFINYRFDENGSYAFEFVGANRDTRIETYTRQLAQASPGERRRDDRPPRPDRRGGRQNRVQKPSINDTIRANIYADNWFKLYINGNLVAVDSISFIPHNVISVDILPQYPMTIAVLARDNADPETGMEYNNTNIGDGGFILKFGDGTVTSAKWKAKSFFHGPINRDTANPKIRKDVLPSGWWTSTFDDSDWSFATEHSEQSVDPKESYYKNDFEGAKWIWTDDLALDNTVIFRFTVGSPPDGNSLPPDWPRGHVDAVEKQK